MKYIALLSIVIVATITGIYTLYIPPQQEEETVPTGPPPEYVTVDTIIDAITVRTTTGHIVRYLGARPPSVASQVQCFGKEAVKANESIIGKELRLETDPVINRSSDGAWLRYAFLQQDEKNAQEEQEMQEVTQHEETSEEDQEANPEQDNEIFINNRILEGGFAFPVVSEDMEYGNRMMSSVQYASATGKGLWGQCEVSGDTTETLRTQEEESCVIKGKITQDQKRIYRTPSCDAYAQTIILESQGDMWFCAEDIAQDAGFAKADDCPIETEE